MKNELFLNFVHRIKDVPTYKVRSSGRFEILGNHTDHNGGLCLAASCDLTIDGYLKINNNDRILVFSEGYNDIEVDINDLSIKENELGTSLGLTKGVTKYFLDKGYKIGGFSLLTKSNIFKGAGVSSSAAFESLIAQILNVCFNDGKISPIELAKAGQYAENNYFGKHSGLLDQSAICFGNVSFMDFKDQNNPKVETISFPFDDMAFVIVNTGGSHARLSDLYSSIPLDMKKAAKKMGKNLLSEGSLDELNKIKDKLSDIEYSRAYHFYTECDRVLTLVNAFKNKDKQTFLKMMRESFLSSSNYLKNMMVNNEYTGSPLEACDLAYSFLKDKGACKINGGGFAGSIIACMDKNIRDKFIVFMSEKYGRENISPVNININSPIVEKL